MHKLTALEGRRTFLEYDCISSVSAHAQDKVQRVTMAEANALPPCNQLSCAPAHFLIELHVHILAAVCILQMLKCLHIDTPSTFHLARFLSLLHIISPHLPIAVTTTTLEWSICLGKWMMVSCYLCDLLME